MAGTPERTRLRTPDYLRAEEVPAVMAALASLFAAAPYTGMRKSELLGLRKTDVDLSAGLLTVAAHSNDRDATKGGHVDAIPIASELVPYLQATIEASPSEYIFPKADGKPLGSRAG